MEVFFCNSSNDEVAVAPYLTIQNNSHDVPSIVENVICLRATMMEW